MDTSSFKSGFSFWEVFNKGITSYIRLFSNSSSSLEFSTKQQIPPVYGYKSPFPAKSSSFNNPALIAFLKLKGWNLKGWLQQ